MTSRFRKEWACPHCGGKFAAHEPWKDYIRKHPDLDSVRHNWVFGDCDMLCHLYANKRRRNDVQPYDYVMVVEFKPHGVLPGYSQRDTLQIFDAIMRNITVGDERDNTGRLTPGHPKNVTPMRVAVRAADGHIIRVTNACAYGTHILAFDADTPAHSNVITWDGHEITEHEMIMLLKFELHPDTRKQWKRDAVHKVMQPAPALFSAADISHSWLDVTRLDDES